MHVEFTEQANAWGGWVFGDLTIAVCRAVEVLGPSAHVHSLAARQPETGPPSVTLTVADVVEVARLREEAELGEYVARFVDEPQDVGWEAEVNGIRLAVEAAEEES